MGVHIYAECEGSWPNQPRHIAVCRLSRHKHVCYDCNIRLNKRFQHCMRGSMMLKFLSALEAVSTEVQAAAAVADKHASWELDLMGMPWVAQAVGRPENRMFGGQQLQVS